MDNPLSGSMVERLQRHVVSPVAVVWHIVCSGKSSSREWTVRDGSMTSNETLEDQERLNIHQSPGLTATINTSIHRGGDHERVNTLGTVQNPVESI